MDRRTFVHMLALTLGVPSATALMAGCGDDEPPMMDRPMDDGMSSGGMPEWMMGGDPMDAQMMRDMRVIRDLLAGHDEIERTVRDVPGGIRSTTTSDVDELAGRIQTHVAQMRTRIDDGDVIRPMDPLFREIFENSTEIELETENVPTGVQVTETSDDPQVTLLIRQHAHRAVSEFVDHGMSRAMRPTPLPEGYRQ